MTTQTTQQKCSITQQLRIDLGRSVGVTTANQLVWITGFRVHHPTPRISCVIKRKHISKFVNKHPYIDNKLTVTPSGEAIQINTQTTKVLNIIYQKIFCDIRLG